jgi:hypothetical protein
VKYWKATASVAQLPQVRTPMERRLRISGVLIILGLIIEAFSLIWIHALAFIFFIMIGGLLMALGILIYLY